MTMTMSYEIYWILDIVDKQYLENCECSSLRRHVNVIVLRFGGLPLGPEVKEEGVQVLVSKIYLDSDLHNEHIYLFIVKFFQLCPIN